jgi:hypothetical protein
MTNVLDRTRSGKTERIDTIKVKSSRGKKETPAQTQRLY